MHQTFSGLDGPVGEELLKVHRSYLSLIEPFFGSADIRGLSHITGGGLVENVPRVLPEAVTAVLEKSAWPRPPLFDWLQHEGGVADAEMHRVFNCGIGMVIVVSADLADKAVAQLRESGEQAWRIGGIRARQDGEAQTLVV